MLPGKGGARRRSRPADSGSVVAGMLLAPDVPAALHLGRDRERRPYTPITEHSSCGTWAICIACACTHRHSFAQSHACYAVAVSSCGFGPSIFTVVLYVLTAGVVVACVFFFNVGVIFVFFSVCLPTGAPGGSPPGFPTEAVGCLLFSFCRCSSWLSGLSLFSPIVFSISFPFLFLYSPIFSVMIGSITCKVL